MTSTHDKIAAFRHLHESGCFVIPNPWDVGSARYLEHLGFKALATTSAGFAWSLGKADNHVTVEEKLAHLKAVVAAVDIPVSADFEGAFAVAPEDVAKNVTRAVATGLAGLSVEDSTGKSDQPLFDFALSVERIKAARAAIDKTGSGVILMARCEGFIVGRPDRAETIKRLQAYAKAGADCVFAPGLRDDLAGLVAAVAPTPLNFNVGRGGFTVAELAAMGVRRISVGGSLAAVAYGEFMRVAQEIAKDGSFKAFTGPLVGPELNKLFS
jgi:2-methylisocitrate lyase-like PEP mutase family enzyme